MQSKKFDHTLILKMTADMRDDIDEALARINDVSVQTRSEFLRLATAYALQSVLASQNLNSCD